MKRTSIRRPISLLLAALLLLGMLAVGGAGTLTASAAISNEAAVVVFKVPETIWLKLENSTTMKTPDKFSNIDDGAGAGVSDTGTVYFSCPGATNITITSDYGTSLTNATSPLSKDMGKTALSTGVTTNTAALVTWTAKFNLPGKGATQYTAKAYSMVWAPSINAFGTTASASTYPFLASRVYAASCLGILGLHSVGGGSGTNSRPNDTFRNDWINGSYCGVDNTWADTTYTSNGSNPNGANSFNHVDNQPGTGNSNAKPSNTNTSNYITVDRSRFTNLNQIPGLRLAFAQTKDDNSNSSWDSNLYFGGALIWSANSGPNQHEGLYGWTSSLIYEITQDDTEQTATATAKFKSSYSSSVQAENNHTISFYVKKANKGTLRGEIKKAENGTTKRYPDEFVTGANATFYSNLQTAVKSLGDPKAAAASYTAPAGADTLKGTTGTATANHIDTQTGQNIETSWMNPKSGTETLAYTYGDVVTAGKETFTGYSYTNRYDSPAATGQTGTGSAYTATESSIRWNFYYDRNNFESNEAVRIITAADSTGKTTPGYYAYVDASPVASGSTIASVSFPTWTDANGQDDLTWHAGTNSSGNHWVTQVPRSGHNGEGGSYATHIYAYDSLGGQNHWDNLKTFSVQFPQVTFYLNTTDQTTVVKTDYCGIGQVWNGTNTPQTGDPRNTYTNMCVPTAPGSDWVFLGWSTNPAAATADYNWVISDPNITAVYAVWQRLYTITFKRGLDGTTYGSHVYSGGSLLTAWTTLDGGKTYATVQGGDAIEGWYTDAEMTNKVNAAVWQVSGAATLYSKLENATRPGINLITTREQAGTYLSGKELPAGFATVA
ncbi:MAG: GBS Bsp-like repeat-containing protein, partial [Oscillospiraceae bacterium]|nr:GBS Bsp-like repeat-containing protein [Oscillospiraceae bacterium]